MRISEMFEKYGEEYFRDRETEAVKSAAAQSGCVIATGGGAVLRPENVAALKQNGRLYFLDRPVEQLIPTRDRPLAGSAEAVRRRYEERYGIYTSCADTRIEVCGSATLRPTVSKESTSSEKQIFQAGSFACRAKVAVDFRTGQKGMAITMKILVINGSEHQHARNKRARYLRLAVVPRTLRYD